MATNEKEKKGKQVEKSPKGSMSVAEAGRKGGLIGGQVTARKYPHEHFEEIGRKGGQKVAELIRRGKEATAKGLLKK